MKRADSMATPDPLIGKTLNGYEITRLIGRGGMATVYEARQISMNRFVASQNFATPSDRE
ncbi:MAG UNVERIFIED_CONTAM: hypothetical protein LVT10_25040 [Anaerolineae bacterium]